MRDADCEWKRSLACGKAHIASSIDSGPRVSTLNLFWLRPQPAPQTYRVVSLIGAGRERPAPQTYRVPIQNYCANKGRACSCTICFFRLLAALVSAMNSGEGVTMKEQSRI